MVVLAEMEAKESGKKKVRNPVFSLKIGEPPHFIVIYML